MSSTVKNKEAIAAALVERYLAIGVDAFHRAMTGPLTFGEIPARVLTTLVDMYRTQPPIHRYMFEMMTATQMHARVRGVLDGCTMLMAHLLLSGGVPDERAREAGTIIIDACTGVIIGVFQRGVSDPTTTAESLAALVCVYLRDLGIDLERPVS